MAASTIIMVQGEIILLTPVCPVAIMLAMHPLEQWRQAQGIDRRAFARKLKKHENSVYLWETYKVVPGQNVMARLQAMTGLEPGDFYPPVAAKLRRRA